MRPLLWVVLVFAALLVGAVAACGGDDESRGDDESPGELGDDVRAARITSSEPTPAPPPTATPSAAGFQGPAGGAGPKAQPAPLPQTRIIVHTARISMVVDDVARTVSEIGDVAADLGGWVVNSDWTSRHSGAIAIRVPAQSLSVALGLLEDLSIEVLSQELTSQDVTDEYVDSQSRLASLRATEKRLLSFLEQANTVKDALLVQEELAKLQLGIEELQGRLNYLQETAAYSLIEASLQVSSVTIAVDAGPDSSVRVGEPARFRASFMPPGGVEDYSFVWDFGDGTSAPGAGSAPRPNGERVTATVNHVYDDDRDSPYIVKIDLSGVGADGRAEGSDSLEVSVSRVPTIEVFAGDYRTVEEGDDLDYNASFTRPEELWDYQYRWDFGDGSPTITGVPDERETRVTAPHSFADYRPTPYTVSVTVSAMSEAGRVSGSSSFSVRVTETEGFTVGGWNIGGTAKSAIRALTAVAKVALIALTWLAIFSPVIIIVAVIAYLANRYGNRLSRRRSYWRPRPPTPPTEQPDPQPETDVRE